METEILNYIKDARAHGLKDQEIKQNLLDVGWEPGQVEEAFTFAKLPPRDDLGKAALPANFGHIQEKPEQTGLPKQPQTSGSLPPVNLTPQAEKLLSFNSQSQTQAMPTVVSDSSFKSLGPKSKKVPVLIAVGILILLGLGAGGWYAYANYFSAKPQKVWNKYLLSKSESIYKTNFAFKYSDAGFNQSPDLGMTDVGPFSLTLSGNTYANNSNPALPEASADIQFAFQTSQGSSSQISITKKIGFKILKKALFVDLSDFPEIGQVEGKPVKWVKLDFEAAKQFASSSPYGQNITLTVADQTGISDKINQDLKNALKKTPLFSEQKIVGTETISGVAAYHLQNTVDKAALKNIVTVVMDDASASSTLGQMGVVGAARQIINSYIDKLSISKLDFWIGKSDSRLYKISFAATAPGIQTILEDSGNPLGVAQAKSRDARRISDMRQMNAAVEMFYNDHNGYPAAKNGEPVGLVPNYVSKVPATLLPADGQCSDYYNTYWYTPTGTPKSVNGLLVYPSYEYSFCLGSDTGGYSAGIHKLTISGISDVLPCTDTEEHCQSTPKIKDNKPAQPAEIKLDITYSDYGKKETLTEPEDAFDLVNYMQNQFAQPTPLQNGQMVPGSPMQ